MPPATIFIETLAALAGRWHRYREDRHTRRTIAGLPRHIRRDIGWPDDNATPARRHGLWML